MVPSVSCRLPLLPTEVVVGAEHHEETQNGPEYDYVTR